MALNRDPVELWGWAYLELRVTVECWPTVPSRS